MKTEIEMKAWVENHQEMKQCILALPARFLRCYEKFDRYFLLQNSPHTLQADQLVLRLRQDGNQLVVTMKNKQLKTALEVSQEREFSVSNSDNFLYLLNSSNFTEYFRKHKIGEAFAYKSFLLELSQVEHLGYFLEIEQVVDEQISQGKITAIGKEIQSIFTKLGIPNDKIEERSYSEILGSLGMQFSGTS